jgi:DNA polymerase III delta prime subunit
MTVFEQSSWMMKYRATSIDDYIFEDNYQKEQVNSWIKNGRIPGNLLLYGPPGTGKSNLAILLINKILNQDSAKRYDLKIIQSRKVKAIDEFKDSGWLSKAIQKSTQKVVLMEEIDKCSKEAQGQLKDGMLEKYQSTTAFICTTNHINKIDDALPSRFNFRYNLKATNRDGIYDRLCYILGEENVTYNEHELKDYVDNNPSIGVRDLINNLQCAVFDNNLSFGNIRAVKSQEEQLVIDLTMKIVNFLLYDADQQTRIHALITPVKTPVKNWYSQLLESLEYNSELDYDIIYREISDQIEFLPVKRICSQYLEYYESKRDKGLHFIAFIYDAIKSLIDLGY